MEIAEQVVRQLARTGTRLVLAESCTGGMVACELAKIAGVSQWWCGSAVTYRCDTKVRWLGVSATDIESSTAVSDPVARQMAAGVLQRTPEASLAVSITGHFGPEAPNGFDGIIFIGTAIRKSDGEVIVDASRHQLTATERTARQIEATEFVFAELLVVLRQIP